MKVLERLKQTRFWFHIKISNDLVYHFTNEALLSITLLFCTSYGHPIHHELNGLTILMYILIKVILRVYSSVGNLTGTRYDTNGSRCSSIFGMVLLKLFHRPFLR